MYIWFYVFICIRVVYVQYIHVIWICTYVFFMCTDDSPDMVGSPLDSKDQGSLFLGWLRLKKKIPCL